MRPRKGCDHRPIFPTPSSPGPPRTSPHLGLTIKTIAFRVRPPFAFRRQQALGHRRFAPSSGVIGPGVFHPRALRRLNRRPCDPGPTAWILCRTLAGSWSKPLNLDRGDHGERANFEQTHAPELAQIAGFYRAFTRHPARANRYALIPIACSSWSARRCGPCPLKMPKLPSPNWTLTRVMIHTW